MEPSSLTMRLSSKSNDSNQEDFNSLHDYKKLPRSSGDGMESWYPTSETGTGLRITNSGHLVENCYGKEDSTASRARNTSFSPTNEVTDDSFIESSFVAELGKSGGENNDSPAQPFLEPDTKNTTCSLRGTEVSNYSATTSSAHVASSLNADMSQNDGVIDPGKSAFGIKSFSLERKAECLDLHSLLKELENRNNKLEAEKEKLSNQLGVQNKVNVDLKKLLVASVGEEVGARLEKMVVDKAQFDATLTNLQTKFDEVSEELGRVSIECDVWRTKFLASRMMTNGLTDIKTTLFMKHRKCQAALEKLLEEQSDIRQHLRATNRLLQGIHDTTTGVMQSTKISWEKTFQKSSIIELAHVNYNMAEDICYSLNRSHYYATINNNSSTEEEIIPVTDLTPAEQMACQVLKTDANDTTGMDLVMKKMGRQYIGNSYASRFLTNNFRVTFDCCDHCKGALKVI